MNAASNPVSAQSRPDAQEGPRNERADAVGAAPTRAHDASMEEILASIRKIIADEQAIPASDREPSEVAYARARGNVAGAAGSTRNPAATVAGNDDGDFEGWLAATASGARTRPAPADPEPAESMRDEGAEAAGPASHPEPVAAGATDVPMEDEKECGDVAAATDMDRACFDADPAERGGDRVASAAFDPASVRLPSFDTEVLRADRAAPQLSIVDPAPGSTPVPAQAAAQAAGGPDTQGPLADEGPLLSSDASSSVNSSFQTLAQSVMLRTSAVMEQAVREMLRPMLKQWLDDNLPPIVERLVRAEIERAARGGS